MTSGPGAAGGQLAVAEGAGASLAEEVVALGIERPVLVEPADVGDAVLDGPAAFQDQRPVTALGQQVAGEEAGRPGADDHGPVLQRAAEPGSGQSKRSGMKSSNARDEIGLWRTRARSLSGRSTAAAIDEMEVVVAAGIKALAEDPPAERSNPARGPAGRRSSRASAPRARRARGGCWRL